MIRITQEELAWALKQLRYPPIRHVQATGPSGHFEQDHEYHAQMIVDAVLDRRKKRIHGTD